MTATPIWFGPAERPLFGFFHTPSDQMARAGVVICPPLNFDYLRAQYALRLLAESLVKRGICVLRLDYDGTGDSAGDHNDPDRVSSWLGSIDEAVKVLRAAGVGSTVLVGMRLGATLAGTVAQRDGDLDGLVLWDPLPSGKAYLAEQRALSAISLQTDSSQDGSVETPGMRFDAATVSELRALDLTSSTGPLAGRVHVFSRPDRDLSRLAARLEPYPVEWSEAPDQARLMDLGSTMELLPYATIERIADWVDSIAAPEALPVVPPPAAGTAVVKRLDDGSAVVETPTFIGPHRLFGILSDAPSGSSDGPTAIFISVAYQHRAGPGAHLWVELARRWAAAGIRSFRLDLSGVGDSPTRHAAQRPWLPHAPEAFDDVIDACHALSPEDPSNVILVGLCASGYQALDSAFQVRPRGVVALNPVLSFPLPELASGHIDPRRRLALARSKPLQWADRVICAVPRRGSYAARVRDSLPGVGTRVQGRLEAIEGSLVAPRRRRALRELTDQGVDVLVVCSEREAAPLGSRASATVGDGAEGIGGPRVAVIPGLDHGLLVRKNRERVNEIITAHVVQHFAGLAHERLERSDVPVEATVGSEPGRSTSLSD